MRVRSCVFLLTLLLIMVLGTNQKPTASTYNIPSACEAFNMAKAVFIGRVVNVSQKREHVYGEETDETYVSCSLEVVFEMIEPFSGAPGRLMNVWEIGGFRRRTIDNHWRCQRPQNNPIERGVVKAQSKKDQGPIETVVKAPYKKGQRVVQIG